MVGLRILRGLGGSMITHNGNWGIELITFGLQHRANYHESLLAAIAESP